MKILNKLKNKMILTATIANIVAILTLLGIIDVVKADLIIKVIGIAITVLVQLGILTDGGNNEL